MPIIRLVLQVPARARPPKPASPILASANLGRTYFPGWGLLYSIVVHVIFFSALIVYPLLRLPSMPLYRPPKVSVHIPIEQRVIMYLPILGSVSRSGGGGLPGKGSGGGRGKTPAASAHRTKGLSYPGPQPILSDVPEPTNSIQTLLQPALVNPPVLPPPLLLPNFVQLANASPIPQLEVPKPAPEPSEPAPPPEQKPVQPAAVQPELRAVAPALPILDVKLPAPVNSARMVLPAGIPQFIPTPEPPPTEPQTPPAQAAPAAAKTAQPAPSSRPVDQPKIEPSRALIEKPKVLPALETSPLPSRGPDPRNIVALTPMPAPPKAVVEVPAGEARGRFAISPEPNLSSSDTQPGLSSGVPAPTPGIGDKLTGAAAGAAGSAETSPNGGNESGPGAAKGSSGSSNGANAGRVTGIGSGAGTGSGSGAGPGSGSGAAGSGTGSGRGAGSGTGLGTGPGAGAGSGAGSGSGKGAGSGNAPFAGITIVGGVGVTGGAGNPPSRFRPPPRPLQTSYGVTIISTETSGGGLPFSGVFQNDPVYTVYLDVRQSETETDPSWPLEFSVVPNSSARPGADGTANRSQQGIVLPFPAVKERPVLPAETVRRYLRRMIIVYAIINVEGRMEQIEVKDSPDALLNEPVVQTLSKWIFRPARLNGEPVPAKVLLGIPLWLPQ